MAAEEKLKEQKYLVFLDDSGCAIGRPCRVGYPEEADAFMESQPIGTKYHILYSSKKEALESKCGLVGEDFV